MAQNNYLNYTDQELISNIKHNSDYLGVVFKKCKSSAIQFLRKINYQTNESIDIEDIFQDAIIVLYENIINRDFKLAANTSLQTYLNSVCRNQLLKKIGNNKKLEFIDNIDTNGNEEYNSMLFNPLITDTLEEFEYKEEKQLIAMIKALEKMKAAGGNCYEILRLFWYEKKSIYDLTIEFGYTNQVNTRNQKSKCQKRLKKITFDLLNN